MPERELSYEYRVGSKDHADECAVYGGPEDVFATVEEAEAIRALVVAGADPPYDDVWIERRPCVDWERVPVAEAQHITTGGHEDA